MPAVGATLLSTTLTSLSLFSSTLLSTELELSLLLTEGKNAKKKKKESSGLLALAEYVRVFFSLKFGSYMLFFY